MTATERAKRSDALYYETVSVTRRVLCDMIANREADLEDARESVNRLMTQRDERLARAEADNAKLRELMRDMWRDGMCECDERGACAECEYHFPDRMRELGVEVNDG
jgi:hypothetical protein